MATAGLDFRCSGERHLLEIDPDRMPAAVSLFERYALGTVSARQLALETDLADSRIQMSLTARLGAADLQPDPPTAMASGNSSRG